MPRSKASEPKSVNPTGVTSTPRAGEDPIYGVAMLKLALELKKSKGKTLDEVLPGVLRKMRIRENDFRTYLTQSGRLPRRLRSQKRS
jgi:hypothetical protein